MDVISSSPTGSEVRTHHYQVRRPLMDHFRTPRVVALNNSLNRWQFPKWPSEVVAEGMNMSNSAKHPPSQQEKKEKLLLSVTHSTEHASSSHTRTSINRMRQDSVGLRHLLIIFPPSLSVPFFVVPGFPPPRRAGAEGMVRRTGDTVPRRAPGDMVGGGTLERFAVPRPDTVPGRTREVHRAGRNGAKRWTRNRANMRNRVLQHGPVHACSYVFYRHIMAT